MKYRQKVRNFYGNGIQNEYEAVINEAYNSIVSSVLPTPDKHSFTLGYIAGMDNPTLEKIIELVRLIKSFNSLHEEEKEMILLMMDGLKFRNNDSPNNN